MQRILRRPAAAELSFDVPVADEIIEQRVMKLGSLNPPAGVD
jgi:hypothetical protein